jgi:hypothetical protein
VRVSGESGAVTSGNFAIKSKTPGIVKVLPFLVAGAVAYFIFSGEDKVEELPSPPTYNGN